MASRSGYGMLEDYSQLNTIPALTGIAFAAASLVQFAGATISVETPSFTLQPEYAVMISLAALLVAFMSSDTNDWRHYETWEQAVVGGAVAAIVGQEYVTEVADFFASNSPEAGLAAFLVCMAAWGVLAR